LLVMVVASPWMYGAVHPGFELLLDVGLLLLLLLWAARMLIERRLTLVRCPVTLLLGALLLLGLWQITPLPHGVLSFLSPEPTALYDTLLPTTQEKLPGDSAQADLGNAPGSTLSLYPAATKHECYRLLAVLLLFVVVRNNLNSAASLWRLAVVLVCDGRARCVF